MTAKRLLSVYFRPKRVILYGVLILITATFLLPYLWLLSSSFKDVSQIFKPEFSLVPRNAEGKFAFMWENWKIAFEYLKLTTLFKNTLIVCVVNVVCNLFFNSLAGYAFARIKFKGREVLFRVILLSMMIPGTVLLVPNLMIISFLRLDESLAALILPFVMSVYNIFLMRQTFMAIEKELEEAAVIDGANRFRIFISVAVPLAVPIMIVLGITTFMWNYNSYMWPLVAVTTNEEAHTLALGLGNLISAGSFNPEIYPAMLAGTVIVSIPLIAVFFFFQKYIMAGINVGGVKG